MSASTGVPEKTAGDPFFAAIDVSKQFGGVKALDRVSVSVDPGSSVGIVGPNGSGKSTLFSLICGNRKPDSGEIYLLGERIDGLPAFRVARRGIGRTFQSLRVFRSMSVLENARFPGITHRVSNPDDRAMEVLEFVGLTSARSKLAGELSYGQQRLLEFAMVLVPQPRLVILDEPIAGVNPVIIEKLEGVIRELHALGVALLIVEHNIRFVSRLCTRVLVLNGGSKIAEGTPQEVRSNPDVIEAYLGREAQAG